MNLIDELKYSFKQRNPITTIILINVCVFVLFMLVNTFLFLLNESVSDFSLLMRHLMLPAFIGNFLTQPWTIITYMFLHEGFFHILFNMLWLFWIGNIFLEYLGNKKTYTAYLGGGIFGGIFYILCYNIFPAFQSSVNISYALGASAGVLSIVVATATLLPRYPISLMFLGSIQLRWIALVSVLLDFIAIPNSNAGGHIAHIGGAAFGFFYIKYIYGKISIPNWLKNIFPEKQKLKVHYSSGKKSSEKFSPSQEDIDLILDKISKAGYESLSKKEKEILFKASKD